MEDYKEENISSITWKPQSIQASMRLIGPFILKKNSQQKHTLRI